MNFAFPIVESLRDYSFAKGRNDLLSGLSLAFLAVPQCMAYSLIAGLPPIYGLYAGFTAVIVSSSFTSSRFLITGPGGSVSLVVGSILYGLNSVDPVTGVVVLSVLVGVLQLALSFLRLGNLARFVSQSVVTGFIVGSGVVIIGDQVFYLLQGNTNRSPYFVKRFYETLLNFYQSGSIPYLTLLLGIGAILFMVVLRYFEEKLPVGLLTILLGAFGSYLFGLGQHGIEIVGTIPTSFPSLTLPTTDPGVFRSLFGGAIALTLLGSVQAVSIARSLASSTRETVNENQELFSQGLSNLVVGVLQGFPVSASFSRSFFNVTAGAKTRLSGVLCGIFILLTIFVAGPVAYYIPIPILSGLIIVVISDIFSWEDIKVALSTTTRDRLAFLATFTGVMLFQLDTAIYVGVAVSLVSYLRKASKLDLKEYIRDEDGELEHITDVTERIESRVALIDVNGEAFFGSADLIKKRIENLLDESETLRVIVLRMKNAMNLDITGAIVLKDIALTLKERDRTLMICGATPHVREVLEESGASDVIGRDKILVAQESLLDSTRQAMNRAQAHISNVLEGEEERSEESQPPLKHTMEQIEDGEDSENDENPIEEERIEPEE